MAFSHVCFIPVCEEPVPRTKKLPHWTVKFDTYKKVTGQCHLHKEQRVFTQISFLIKNV